MPMIVHSAMLFNNKLPAGLCAPRVVTVQGRLANLALLNVRRVQGRHLTTVLSALPALIHSTVVACKRTAMVFARVRRLLPTTTSTSVIVSAVLHSSWITLSRFLQVVDQSVLLAKSQISMLRRQSTRLSVLVACLDMSFTKGLACRVALRAPSCLLRITLLALVRNI